MSAGKEYLKRRSKEEWKRGRKKKEREREKEREKREK
jgi:hypothetical protein